MVSNREQQILDLIAEIEEEIAPSFSHLMENADQCEVCGCDEWAYDTVLAESVIEQHSIECQKCNTEFWTDYAEVGIENVRLNTAQHSFKPSQCPSCGNSPPMLDRRAENKPTSVSRDYRFVRYIVYNQMACHHTDYKEPKTMTVCNSCHSKIHHKPGFRDDLEPFMSREEARQLGYVKR